MARKPSGKTVNAVYARRQKELAKARLEWQTIIATRIFNSTGRKMGVLADK